MIDDATFIMAMDDFNLDGYLREKNFDHLGGAEWEGDCPKCLKKKVAVNSDKKAFHCWICQETEQKVSRAGRTWSPAKGGLVGLIMWLEEKTFGAAKEYLIQNTCPSFDLSELSLDQETFEPFKGYIDLPPGAHVPDVVPPYLEKRGVSLNYLRSFNIAVTPYGGKYGTRAVFSCYEDGKLVFWQARAMYNQEDVQGRYIKVLNPPKEHGAPGPKDVLMNLDIAATYPYVVITEGPMDAVRTGPDAVCTFGKTISPTQVAKLAGRGVREVVLMWDADAKDESVKAKEWLSQFFKTSAVYLQSGDPGDHSQAELRILIEKARES